MPELLLANAIAPVVSNFRGGVFLVLSIIPIEALVLWLFFNKVLRVNISIPRVLILSAIANIISGLFGVIFPLGSFVSAIGGVVFVLGFIMSVPIEWIIYKGDFEKKKCPICGLITAALLANLVSYTCLFVILTDLSQSSPNFVFLTNPSYAHRQARSFSYIVLGLQEKFYRKHSHFAPTFQQFDFEFDIPRPQLPVPGRVSYIPRQLLAPDRAKDKYYEYAMDGKQSKYTLRAFPKEENFKSYISVKFAVVGEDNEPKFIAQFCRSDWPSVPPIETPQLVRDEIKCPPGFLGEIRR